MKHLILTLAIVLWLTCSLDGGEHCILFPKGENSGR